MNKVKVGFQICDTKIMTIAAIPAIANEEGRKVMTVNNAVNKIRKELHIDLKKLVSDIASL